ncbi:MAG: hypothetical protein IT207_10105 [Fimbriimonadaceae bacterium]|nr:hypothetical protein [Fimbriimonadaceae bacterium]
MGHGLGAVLLTACLVTPSGWIKTPSGYPYNYLEALPYIDNSVYSFTNSGTTTVNHQVGGQHQTARKVWGSALEGPPATSGPTWGAKFTPRSDSNLVTNWEVNWDVPAGYTFTVTMEYSHEVGTETWWRNSVSAARDRSWHTFVKQGHTEVGPGGGEPGGGG